MPQRLTSHSLSSIQSAILHALLGLMLIVSSGALTACNTAPDKRVLQYLNTRGFGNRYTGNAEHENYITITDGFQWFDELSLTEGPRGGNAVVDIDGTVTFEDIGRTLHVAGMTRSELESYLTQQFSAVYSSTSIKVTQIQNRARKVYYVLGEVGVKGPRPFEGDLTIFQAVLLAGPDPATANLGRIKLIRADPVDPLVMRFDMRDMTKYGDSTFNVLVHENDIIIITPTIFGSIANFLVAVTSPFSKLLQTFSQSVIGLTRLGRLNTGNNAIF